MDFGLAKLKHDRDITKTGSTVGTLAYSSPEQIRGEQVGPRSDLFSLGIVLYEMLTGKKPFQGEHRAAMTYAIVNEDPAPLSRYLSEAPEELIQIFDKLLAKEPEDRFGNASQVASFLEDVNESADIFSKQYPSSESKHDATAQNSDSGSTTLHITVPDFGFGKKSLGKTSLVAGVVVVLALVIFGGWWFVGGISAVEQAESQNSDTISSGTSQLANNLSIAVLPFTNLGGSGKAEPLSKGIHEDLITRLSNISDLRVKSRTAVGSYSDMDLGMAAIAESLDVRWIVGGGVMEMGDQVKVNARLVDPRNDSNIWADNYLRELTAENFFAIQGDITREIADALQAELSEGEQQRIAGAPTQNLEAYRLYAEGRQLMITRQPDSLSRAIDHFRRALEQDSSYALAWSGLADARILYTSYSMAYSSESAEENLDTMQAAISEAETAAEKALRLNPDLAEAHASWGFLLLEKHYFAEGVAQVGPEALRHLERAVELKPSYAEAHHWLGSLLLELGRPESGLKHLQLSIELSPNNISARRFLISALIATGKYEEALRKVQRLRHIPPKGDELVKEVEVLVHLKRWADVRALIREARSKTDDPPPWTILFLALTDAATGDEASARSGVEELRSQGIEVPAALIQAVLGEVDLAFEALPDVKDWIVIEVLAVRYYNPDLLSAFRADPRYDKLIREINEFWGLNPDGSIPQDYDLSDYNK